MLLMSSVADMSVSFHASFTACRGAPHASSASNRAVAGDRLRSACVIHTATTDSSSCSKPFAGRRRKLCNLLLLLKLLTPPADAPPLALLLRAAPNARATYAAE